MNRKFASMCAIAVLSASISAASSPAFAQAPQYLDLVCRGEGGRAGDVTYCDGYVDYTFSHQGTPNAYWLRLTAPPVHCAVVSYMVYLKTDVGYFYRGETPYLNAGEQALIPLEGQLRQGQHTYGISAKSRIGGCNTGRLQSWGVTVGAETAP